MTPELSTTVGLSVTIIGTLPKRAYTACKLPIPLYIYRQTDTYQVVVTFQWVEHQKSVGTGRRQTDSFTDTFCEVSVWMSASVQLPPTKSTPVTPPREAFRPTVDAAFPWAAGRSGRAGGCAPRARASRPACRPPGRSAEVHFRVPRTLTLLRTHRGPGAPE
jgi:hypothetical protein